MHEDITHLPSPAGLNDMFGRPTKTKPEKPLCSSTSCPPQNLRNAEALVKWAAATDVVRNALYVATCLPSFSSKR